MQPTTISQTETLEPLYPKYLNMFPTLEPADEQPRKFGPPTRFKLFQSRPQFLWKDFHLQNSFWIPQKSILNFNPNPRKTVLTWEERRTRQILSIMQSFQPSKNNCWIWAGGKTGGYPIVSYNGRQIRTVKVLVAWLINDVPEMGAKRLCNSHWCINPSHHEFSGLRCNLPIDPNFLPIIHEGPKKYWKTDEVLPWEDLKVGMQTQEAQILNTSQKSPILAPRPGQTARDFFKITGEQ